MTWVATAIIGGAVIGGGASVLAADKQAGATKDAINAQQGNIANTRTDLAPYRSAGNSALQALMARLGIGPDTSQSGYYDVYNKGVAALDAAHKAKYGFSVFDPRADAASRDQQLAAISQQASDHLRGAGSNNPQWGSLLKPFTGADLASSPGYQFNLTEGEKAINNLAASRGSYFSGGAAKDLTKYATDYAGTKFNDAFNQDQATKAMTANLLSGVSNQGMGATNTGVNASTSGTNSIADLMTQGGNAQAAGIVGPANAVNQGIGNYINWQNQSRTLDLLRSPSYGSNVSGSASLGSRM